MRETVATVSRLVLFALHCRSARLQTCCFSLFAFRLFLRLNQKSPFAPREVSRCRLLSLLQSSGSASFTCFVSLLSALLRLSSPYEDTLFLFLPGSAASFTLHRFCLALSLFFSRGCCVVPAGALVISLRLRLTTKVVTRSFSVYRRLRLCFLCCTVCFCSL